MDRYVTAKALVAALALAAAGACRAPLPELSRGQVPVRCCDLEAPVVVEYLGVGGWLFRHRQSAVLAAPLYSNPGLVRTGLGRIATDTARVAAHLPDVSDVTAILVGHAHYDHLMDVPWIMKARAPRATVYGSRTMAHTLAPFGLDPSRIEVVEDSAGDAGREGGWIAVGEGVRIMPVASAHAPHFAGMTLYSGEREAPMERPPETAEEWLEGRTLAYLVDFLEPDGSVAFRVFYQDAVAAPPAGIPPEVDDGHGVDLAIVVPATYAEVSWHPERLLERTRPRHVLLGHWENLFEPPDPPFEPVPFTDLGDFADRLEAALDCEGCWHVPVPGTRFVFR